MPKIILTRNFKGKTDAKYCASYFGTKPADALEVNAIALTNIEVCTIWAYDETAGFADFGCMLIIVGDGTLDLGAIVPPLENPIAIEWNGFDFFNGEERLRKASHLVASETGIEILA